MVKKIQLSNFRNFKSRTFEFSDKTTVIVGPNASGKTNILESLSLLSTGKSFKAKVESEMINYNQELAKVGGKLVGPISLEAILTRGENGWPRKKLLVSGVAKRLVDFAGNFKTVLFGPWDLDLVTEAPTLRRRFLDNAISQVDREYGRALLSYEKGLRQRNRLLFRIREEGLSRSQLLFWNQLLIRNGNFISQKRQEFIEFINSSPRPGLGLEGFMVEYDKSAISEARLEQYAEEELAAATTLVGPHRDDFVVKLKTKSGKQKVERDLARFGSRGEQRMGVLWLKLAELEFIEAKTGERPTLFLDDIFSELDYEHRKVVVKAAGAQQTIITTADPHFIERLKKVEKIKLSG